MGVEAEALGAGVNFYSHHTDIVYPTITKKVSETVADLDLQVPSDMAKAGRIPLVLDAIRQLKAEVGNQVAIGAWVLGPYTLAGQLVDIGDLAKMAFKKKAMVDGVLDKLADVLIDPACRLCQGVLYNVRCIQPGRETRIHVVCDHLPQALPVTVQQLTDRGRVTLASALQQLLDGCHFIHGSPPI
jgi:hypothetical protein